MAIVNRPDFRETNVRILILNRSNFLIGKKEKLFDLFFELYTLDFNDCKLLTINIHHLDNLLEALSHIFA